METIINQRLRTIADIFYNGNVSALAAAAGVGRPALNAVLNSETTIPRFDMVARIAKIIADKVSLDWLILGEGEMLRAGTPPPGAVTITGNNNAAAGRDYSAGDPLTIAALTEQLRTKDEQIKTLLEILKTR